MSVSCRIDERKMTAGLNFYDTSRADDISLGEKSVPKMEVNGALFVYQKENRENLLAQTVATTQHSVHGMHYLDINILRTIIFAEFIYQESEVL